jgi:branched-chain amino acid transport system permease protein
VTVVAPILVSALVSGSLYALLASGLAFVWGTVRIFNFGQGALLMLGAYAAYYLTGAAHGPALSIHVAVFLVIGALSAVGALLYLILVKPFIGSKDANLIVIVATISAATFFEDGVDKLAGGNSLALSTVFSGSVHIFNTTMDYQEVAMVVVAPFLLLGLAVFLARTRTGMAIRAVEQNPDAAALVGIHREGVYLLVFAISAALAAVAGVLYGGEFGIVPTMGDNPLVIAFIVVVFGGLGSLPGAVLAAYIIGLVEAVSNYYIGLFWTPAILFGVLLAALLLRPNGLLGDRQ